MANEITITALLKLVDSDGSTFQRSVSNLKADQAGAGALDNVQTIGTSEEALVLGDNTAGGYCFLQNMDPTNFVSIRQATSASDMIKVGAGEVALFRFDADCTAPYAIADTAAVRLRVLLLDL